MRNGSGARRRKRKLVTVESEMAFGARLAANQFFCVGQTRRPA